ncbi:MAG: hypothetical protein ACLPUO_00230 [Streptosporangiaceae bacterium]
MIALAVGVVLALPGVTGPASRKIAFRADRAGITLGADLFNLPFRFSAVFVPWQMPTGSSSTRGRGHGGATGTSGASESSAAREPRPSPGAASRPPAARYPA